MRLKVWIGLLTALSPSVLYAHGDGAIYVISFMPPLLLPVIISVVAHNLLGAKGQKTALPVMLAVSLITWFLIFGQIDLELGHIILLSFATSLVTLFLTIIVRRFRESSQSEL